MNDQNNHVQPGQLISADLWNQTMDNIEADISSQISTAIQNIESVPKAGDADKFGGQTPDAYAAAIVARVLHELPKRTGYMTVFKDLKVGEESVVEHRLGACPLTDIYQLDYFRVVASEDDRIFEAFTTFYLYQGGESKIRFRPEESPTEKQVSINIDPPDGHAYRIPFARMLALYDVEYDDSSSLGDVENDFWSKFLSQPNDAFDDNQYYHSPWFDRCCTEGRTVKQIKSRREWDDIYFQMRPFKTFNYNPDTTSAATPDVWPGPTKIQTAHFDFDTLGLTLIETPVISSEFTSPASKGTGFPVPDSITADHLKVMVLLKV
jgi:hypothetical protein